ncbi:MAG: GNAT family N-acetyltransferase [Betaproteobacteria bacterium]|nr:GNAT family N-acetyltransferase [Betaproteobacteria bacterium]
MSVRRLVPSQAAAYRALMLDAYTLHPEAYTSSAEERGALPLSWWESRLAEDQRPAELVLGAFHAGELAGVAGLSFEAREKARHKATLFGLYVRPESRHLGLGRQLVEAALAQAGARPGVRLVQLTVTQGNDDAHRLYARHGFVDFGLEPLAVAVGGGFVAKIHMWCPLRPGDGDLSRIGAAVPHDAAAGMRRTARPRSHPEREK